MKHGLNLGIDFADYARHQSASKSLLIKFRKTPAHAKAILDGDGAPSTPSQSLGTLAHTLILEPHQFDSRYAVGPEANRNTKVWTSWAAEQADGKTLLKPSEHEAGLKVARSIERKPNILSLLRAEGPVEASIAWRDPLFGFDCKGRPDKIAVAAPGMLLDIKTTTDLSDRALSKTIHNYGYHIQARFYLDGLAEIGHRVERSVVVWIETAPPHEVRATEFLPGCDWLEMAATELHDLKAEYARCIKTGIWPGYEDEIVECPPPPSWAHDELGDTELIIDGAAYTA